MTQQTPSDSGENNTRLFSKPAYFTETSSALEIHIIDCFWYPRIPFDWKKLTPQEFHYLIDKIRTGLLYIAQQNFPAEENIDIGFSRMIDEYRQKKPDGRIGIILHPVTPYPVTPYPVTPHPVTPYPITPYPVTPYPERSNPAYDNSGGILISAEISLAKKKRIIYPDIVKRWMEFKELQNKVNLAYELKRTGGYIVRTAAVLRCTRQQIHTAMRCHGFLQGEIMIFRGGCCWV